MKSTVEIDTDKAETVKRSVEQSLQTDDRVSYSLKAEDSKLKVKVETDSVGVLRGSTDTVFRLLMTSKKILED